MRDNLNKGDQRLRVEANGLLHGKGLLALLEEYGKPYVTGSYALKLMVWRDLDIYLVAKSLSIPTFFELGHRIAASLRPQRMHFRNERNVKTKGLPHGLYWGIYLGDEPENSWKVDIWAINAKQFKSLKDYHEAIANRLTEDTRLNILEIKSVCWKNPGYRKTFTSQDIYRAVLDESVNDLPGFCSYLQRVKGISVEI